MMSKQRYPTDLSEQQWQLIAPLLPLAKSEKRLPEVSESFIEVASISLMLNRLAS